MIYGNKSFWSDSLRKNVRQVRKDVAKKSFENFQTVYLMSSNMRLDNFWVHPCPINKNKGWERDFENILNEFSYYNCDSERGKYIHFFVEA